MAFVILKACSGQEKTHELPSYLTDLRIRRNCDDVEVSRRYLIYDYADEAEHVLDEDGWGRGILAVLDLAVDWVGDLSIEFLVVNKRRIIKSH